MENNLPPLGNEQPPMDTNVPPSYQDQQVPQLQSQSSWPMVIGIISIVFGSLSALGSVYQAAAPFLMGMFGGFVPGNNEHTKAIFEIMATWRFPMLGVGLVSLVLSIILIVSGIKLVSRNAAGVGLHRKWAIAKILFSFVAVTVNTLSQMAQMKVSMEQQSQSMGNTAPAVIMENMMVVMLVFMILIGLVFACAYPIFILIWFSRDKVKKQVQSWEAPADQLV